MAADFAGTDELMAMTGFGGFAVPAQASSRMGYSDDAHPPNVGNNNTHSDYNPCTQRAPDHRGGLMKRGRHAGGSDADGVSDHSIARKLFLHFRPDCICAT